MNDQALLNDLTGAEETSRVAPPGDCKACALLDTMSGDARKALAAALGGTIGRDRLAAICKRNGLDISRWTISQHRLERHIS